MTNDKCAMAIEKEEIEAFFTPLRNLQMRGAFTMAFISENDRWK